MPTPPSELTAQILELGVAPGGVLLVHTSFSKVGPAAGGPHGLIATIHLAEALAGVRYRRPKSVTIIQAGQLTRHHYSEIDHCCENFNLDDLWLDAEQRQRRGPVGHGEARLARSRDVVAAVSARLRANETALLHEPGVDIQCDEARASIRSPAAS